ncbi:MFS transporter [Diaminobutyricimonas aerilata]|uniref:MFS transporter n=1 Tax=Diaminobutyricimonas aerilata TaxID=1162967 RepID=A0A2M9CNP4_9MICO|nr:MFS transporter [Diaminobutyricimonas aerilata]PJJ73535.1 MFS transporter [Diaminobutyricimonas aerilata]
MTSTTDRIAPASDTSTPSSAQRWTTRTWLLLLVVCIVIALDGLDVSMVGVALPSIGTELSLETGTLQWIVSAYVLGYGSLLLLGGRLADLLGRRRILLIALGVFAVASLAGGLVSDPAIVIASRFVKGIAAAFTAPAAFSLITTNFAEGPSRNRAISIFTTFAASGFSLGLIVGGLMTSLSWRWTFLFSVPFAVAALVLGLFFIPRDRRAENGGHDIWGAVTLAVGMLSLVYTVVSAPEVGWGSLQTILGLVGAGLVLAAFAIIELRAKHPLIRFGILREGSVARANISAIALFGSYVSFQFILTIYLQSVLGWQPLSMALALLPAGLVVVATAPFADRLIDRFGSPLLITVALGALSLGYLLFLRVGTEPVYAVDILPSVLLLGAGFALGFPAIQERATSGISNDEQGLAAGLVQSSSQVGAALVLAVTTALIAGGGQVAGASAGQLLDGFRPGLVLSTVVALVGFAVALAPRRRPRTARRSLR